MTITSARGRRLFAVPLFAVPLFAVLMSACAPADRPPLAVGRIDGRAVFVGPIPQAPVRLVRWIDGRPAGQVAQAQTDDDGHFQLAGLRLEAGTYRLHVDAGDTPWARAGRAGRHPSGLTLTATLDHARFAEQAVAVTPLTTLADAAADALHANGVTDPMGRARAGLTAHVGFDPVFTPVGDPLADLASQAALHRLVVDGVAALGDQLGAQAGLSPGTLAPADVLSALVTDARGTDPAAWFDGLGPLGPIALRPDLPLDPDALRHDLAAIIQALVAEDGAWAGVTPQALAPLVRRLTCSPSSLFPACDPAAVSDETPPVIDAVEPAPGAELSGLVDVTVRAHDPDGALARVQLTVLLPNRRLAVPPRPGPDHVFRIDTGAIQGTAWLDVEVEAINAAGLRAIRPARWPLADRGEGVLRGWIHKGPAAWVRVRAYDLSEPPQLLANGTTDGDGAFALPIIGYVGPVRLEAADDIAAEGDRLSGFDDEVRGWTRWGSDHTLSALVPEFRSSAPPEPVIVSPLTDLALAKARHAEAQGQLLVGAYDAALAQLGDLLGLPADPRILLHLRPASLERPFAALEDPERLSLALGCLSEQASGLAPRADPGLFTPLDLMALYRADVRADGLLDGRAGGIAARYSTPEGAIELPIDPLRTALPQACARWLGRDRSGLSAVRTDVVRWIHRLAGHSGEGWIDPELAPPAFDDGGPTVVVSALIDTQVEDSRVHNRDLPTQAEIDAQGPEDDPSARKITVMRGEVVLRVRAQDLAGVRSVDVELEGVLDPAVLTPTDPLDADGSDQHTVFFRLDTAPLEERAYRIRVRAEDPFGNRRDEVFVFEVDRTPPTLQVQLPLDPWEPDGPQAAHRAADGWYTRHDRVPGLITASDRSPYTVTATFQLDTPVDVSRRGGSIETGFHLNLAGFDEGRYRLHFEAVDVLGQRTALGDFLWLDRTPPTVAVDPSACPDEAELPADGDPEGVPTLPLDATGGAVRLWQTTWARNQRPVGCWAHFRVNNGPYPAGGVTLTVRGCLVDPDAPAGPCLPDTERDWTLTGGAERRLPFTTGDGMLPFDPMDAQHTTHTFALRAVVATDPAGNTTRLVDPPIYDLAVVAPTLDVTFDDPSPDLEVPEGVVDLRSLDYDGGLARWLAPGHERADLLITRVTVTNPHPIPVNARISLTQPTWRLQSKVAHVLYSAEPYAGTVVDSPECAQDIPRLDGEPKGLIAVNEACRLAPDGLHCDTCLPPPDEDLDLPLGNATMHGGDQFVPLDQAEDGAFSWPLRIEPGVARQVALALEASGNLRVSEAHQLTEREPLTRVAHAELVTHFGLEHRRSPIPESSGWYAGLLLKALVRVDLRSSQPSLVRLQSQLGNHLTGTKQHPLSQRLLHTNPTLDGDQP